MGTVWWKISVEGGPSYLKLINDVTNERIIFSVFEHRLGIFDFLVIQCTRSTAPETAFVAAASPALVFSTMSSRWKSSKAAVM
ncbi:hypothetical protein V9K92_02815 [Phyllobacterium sp. CCNWLW109]|uniref:hypothetical protein n=1 Tax=Phyllobacterium sp. CCNWLW109 TaxID=3127479 RepID=UPI003076A731